MKGAVQREPEQLPAEGIAKHLGPGAGHADAPRIRRDHHPVRGRVDPVRHIRRRQHHIHPARGGLQQDHAVARHGHTRHIALDLDHVAARQGDDRGILARQLHPVGGTARRIGALGLALDGDADAAIAIVPRDMGLVAVAVGHKDPGIVHPCPLGKAENVEGKEDIDEIGQDHRGHRHGNQPFAPEQRQRRRLPRHGCVKHRHGQTLPTSLLR